jgi:hypothetical protein
VDDRHIEHRNLSAFATLSGKSRARSDVRSHVGLAVPRCIEALFEAIGTEVADVSIGHLSALEHPSGLAPPGANICALGKNAVTSDCTRTGSALV